MAEVETSPLEQLKAMVQEKYPHAKVVIEKPPHHSGGWWLDVKLGEQSIAVRWFEWSAKFKVFPLGKCRENDTVHQSFNTIESVFWYIEELIEPNPTQGGGA